MLIALKTCLTLPLRDCRLMIDVSQGKSLLTFESVFCRPIARPSKTEWSDRERKSMKERKEE